jgi:hypothetical protein
MIPLVPDPEDLPAFIRTMAEGCCFCGRPTRMWFQPKDVAVCVSCAKVRNPEEVPTKEQWCESPQGQGRSSMSEPRRGMVATNVPMGDNDALNRTGGNP